MSSLFKLGKVFSVNRNSSNLLHELWLKISSSISEKASFMESNSKNHKFECDRERILKCLNLENCILGLSKKLVWLNHLQKSARNYSAFKNILFLPSNNFSKYGNSSLIQSRISQEFSKFLIAENSLMFLKSVLASPLSPISFKVVLSTESYVRC